MKLSFDIVHYRLQELIMHTKNQKQYVDVKITQTQYEAQPPRTYEPIMHTKNQKQYVDIKITQTQYEAQPPRTYEPIKYDIESH